MPSLFKLGLATLASFASHAAAGTIGPINIGPYKGITLTISKENTINSTNPINFVNGITSRSDVESIGNLRNRGVLEERQSQNPVFNFGVFPFGGGSTTVNAYISGIRQSDGAMVFVDKNGNWYIPKATPNQQTTIPANSITIPVPTNSKGAGFNVTLPGAIAGGRVSFVVNGTLAFFTNGGSNGVASIVMPSASASGDPSFNYFWGFSEFTFNGGGDLYMNPSAVDFAG
ncbi:hypothetical protein PRZ48_001958 [Zasmidium cellare]|uniref:GH64 domain-containing protein n=1 Tax=Zasmidium cellare TaxID=395010 RepID=A0ABR0F3D6_ZASCE|nr:hypothetical protein PRZ48_001958 [Zasmidium cellare]